MKDKDQQMKPLARKEGLVIQELPDEVLVYDLDRDRAHCLNQTAAKVWQSCNGRRSTNEIARNLSRDLDCLIDEKVVLLALDQLNRNHLLDGKLTTAHTLNGINRRAMIRSLGLAAAISLPIVTSILAPTPAQANTCLGTGASCSTGAECCSTVCNANACT